MGGTSYAVATTCICAQAAIVSSCGDVSIRHGHNFSWFLVAVWVLGQLEIFAICNVNLAESHVSSDCDKMSAFIVEVNRFNGGRVSTEGKDDLF